MRWHPKSFTLYKRNKQLQNSLWLRINSGQIAFMQSRLINSTKFHFGNIENNLQINNKQSKTHNNNKPNGPHIVDSFHWPWPDPLSHIRASQPKEHNKYN